VERCYLLRMLFGVDAGGTSTAVVARDRAGDVVAQRQLASISATALGSDTSLDNLVELCNWISTTQAGEHSTICIGSSNVYQIGIDAMRSQLVDAARKAGLSALIAVVDDPALPLYASPLNGIGVAVISGTGSVVIGRDSHGTLARCGGYDYVISDDGSAFDIGWRGLRAAARAFDGSGPASQLVQRAEGHYRCDIPSIGAKLSLEPFPKTPVADFAASVSLAAEAGDGVARDIIHSTAVDLAGITVAAQRKLTDTRNVMICGSVAAKSALFASTFENELRASISDVAVTIVESAETCALDIAAQVEQTGQLSDGLEDFTGFLVEV
jgi:N-acetylglucosamine kinase-like BadF-type ATPase